MMIDGKAKLTDEEVEKIWEDLIDVPFDENECGELILSEKWHGFEAGTEREEIWHWFDRMHSKGIAWLLYENNFKKLKETIDKGDLM